MFAANVFTRASAPAVRAELLELTRLGGLELREEARVCGADGACQTRPLHSLLSSPRRAQVFDVLLELTRLDVVPTAVSQARARSRHLWRCAQP